MPATIANPEFIAFSPARELGSVNISPSLAHTAAAKSLQSCPTLCDPMDCSPPGSSSASSHSVQLSQH